MEPPDSPPKEVVDAAEALLTLAGVGTPPSNPATPENPVQEDNIQEQ